MSDGHGIAFRLAAGVLLGTLVNLAAEGQAPGSPVSAPKIGSAPTIESAIAAPRGYRRITAGNGSFGTWLRGLPLRSGRTPVRLHDGRLKQNQRAHHAVIDIDVGAGDLQQCADAVIRLRAEYLFAGQCQNDIRFNFTSGHAAYWRDWQAGQRPTVTGGMVTWSTPGARDASYESFRRYLDVVFTYAGSLSLDRELLAVDDPAQLQLGDVFVQGGSPGHAVLVVDVAENSRGQRVFLLAQSYMPAQDIHVLKSPENISPWYRAQASGVLRTPEWTFDYGDAKRFQPTTCEL